MLSRRAGLSATAGLSCILPIQETKTLYLCLRYLSQELQLGYNIQALRTRGQQCTMCGLLQRHRVSESTRDLPVTNRTPSVCCGSLRRARRTGTRAHKTAGFHEQTEQNAVHAHSELSWQNIPDSITLFAVEFRILEFNS